MNKKYLYCIIHRLCKGIIYPEIDEIIYGGKKKEKINKIATIYQSKLINDKNYPPFSCLLKITI